MHTVAETQEDFFNLDRKYQGPLHRHVTVFNSVFDCAEEIQKEGTVIPVLWIVIDHDFVY